MSKIGIYFDSELFDDEALQHTPDRIRRMMKEFKEWRDWNELENGRGIFANDSNDIIVVKDIQFTSFCAHHLMAFSGTASIVYLPGGHVVGLSKLARTVRKFASRPQLQENMTAQIADYLMKWVPDIQGVMVRVSAEHSCMQVRGARMTGTTQSSAIRGKFETDASLKAEGISLIQ